MTGKSNSKKNLELLENIENQASKKAAREPIKWVDEKEITNKDGEIVGYKPLKTTRNYKCLLKNLNLNIQTNIYTRDIFFNADSHLNIGSNRFDAMAQVFADELICLGLNENRNTVALFLAVEASENEYNPIADWLNGLPVEADTEYLEAFIKDVYRIKERSEEVAYKKRSLIKTWFLQAVAAALSENDSDCFPTVLTFTGNQGAGKTTFASKILPEEVSQYVKTGAAGIDLSNKDDISKITSAFITELGEISSSFRRSNVDTIKAFLSSPQDEYRMAYARAAEKHKRRTVFISSNNNPDFLVDKTGNRRFLCVNLSDERSEFWWRRWDMKKVWAQAKFMYDSGMDWSLTSEENEFLSSENENAMVINPMGEAIEATFSLDLTDEILEDEELLKTVRGAYPDAIKILNTAEVYNVMFPSPHGDVRIPSRYDAKAIRHFLLTRFGESKPIKTNGTVKRAWRLICLNGNDAVYNEILKIIEDHKKPKIEGPF